MVKLSTSEFHALTPYDRGYMTSITKELAQSLVDEGSELRKLYHERVKAMWDIKRD